MQRAEKEPGDSPAESDFDELGRASGTIPTMKRPGRWLFNLAAGASFVACIAAAAGWVESYRALDSLDLGYRTGTQWRIHSSQGRIAVNRTIYIRPINRSSAIKWEHLPNSIDFDNSGWRWGGFDVKVRSQRLLSGGGPVSTTTSVRIPHWFLVFGASILPLFRVAVLLRDRHRLRMVAENVCLNCGYDLRATPERCPECGTAAFPVE